MAAAGGGDAASFGTREGFLKVYEEITEEILAEIRGYGLPEEAVEWTREMILYNVPGGKLNRGLTVVHALQAIRGAELTAEEARRAAVLGWCIEWLQAFFLVADDIMDASVTRRGAPCWYRKPTVGMIAINDSFMLNAHLFRVLKTHFGGDAGLYLPLIELFNETTWQTELGQLLDLTTSPPPGSDAPLNLSRFTLERYALIVKHKTAFYSFYLPVACALILAGCGELATSEPVKRITLQMGEYFQIQDDVLDAFADEAVLGKVGTDIQDAKCSWLVVQALKRATPEQRALLEAHYGKHDPASVAAVKALYREQGLQEYFDEYEGASYGMLQRWIGEATADGKLPAAVFTALLGKIYKRSH